MRIVAAIGILALALGAYVLAFLGQDNGLAAGLFAGAALYDLGAGFLAYFLPSWIALARSHRELPAIVTLNVLVGWTVVGWLAAMIWALSRLPAAEPPAAGRTP